MRGIEFIGQSVKYVGGYGGAESIESAARTCTQTSAKGKPTEFVRSLLKNHHMSPLEFGFADFLIECDRAIQQELTRHRLFSFNVESTRWCVAGTTRLSCTQSPKVMTVAELYDWSNQWKRRSIKQYDSDSGTFTHARPLDVVYNGKKSCVMVTTKLGYSIECTPDHRLLTERGWVEAGLLNVGDTVYVNGTETAHSDTITSIDDAGMLDVYDVVMRSEHHNFVASGFIAHNCDYRRKPLRFVTKPPKGMTVPEEAVELLEELCEVSADVYDALLALGAPRDYARKAFVLALASKMRMAGNLRCWLEMIPKRLNPAAHAEVREVAKKVLRTLSEMFAGVFEETCE